ncbi:MAG: hypothetical protein LBQ96_06810 [Fusobacteriaceae bacterium]|nr:hypothetical protein [Fusobacteriaceae bacterium]
MKKIIVCALVVCISAFSLRASNAGAAEAADAATVPATESAQSETTAEAGEGIRSEATAETAPPAVAVETDTAALPVEADPAEELTAYRKEINRLALDIQTTSRAISLVDRNDLPKVIATYREVIEKLTPLYEKLGSLTPPANLAEEQKIIKEGVDASLEIMNLSREIFEAAGDPDHADPAEVTKKVDALKQKGPSLRDKATAMNEALLRIQKAAP